MSTKCSNSFQETIKAYLDKRAAADALFAKSYDNPDKNIEQCCSYIIQEVQRLGVAGLTDDEVFSLAVHYYDESDLGEIKPANCRVVVNHVVELSEEEKAEAKLEALKRFEQDEYERLRKECPTKSEAASVAKAAPKAKKPAPAPQPSSPSLFDEF